VVHHGHLLNIEDEKKVPKSEQRTFSISAAPAMLRGVFVTRRISNLVGAVLLFVGLASNSAVAANGFTTADVNMRAGPGAQYPIITTVPAGAGVTIYGCVRGWRWCDTNWRGIRGWVSARFLEAAYRGDRVLLPAYGVVIGVPIIAFGLDYWDDHYRDRPWYRERHRWFERVTWRERRDWREREQLRDQREQLRDRRERLRDRRERLRDRRDRDELRDRGQVESPRNQERLRIRNELREWPDQGDRPGRVQLRDGRDRDLVRPQRVQEQLRVRRAREQLRVRDRQDRGAGSACRPPGECR
jgi:uncharacterized protein YraI